MDAAPVQTSSLTEVQQRAVAARGNVLVMAGAGTGKTKTLVERCLDCLERDHAGVDELLIVTFTEAAAAEMRERLRHAMTQRLEAAQNPPQEEAAAFWAGQLARFDLAHIGTLHGFCLKLVREHFYELGLDPRLAVLDEGEAFQLARETLDEQFTAHYEQEDEFSLAVQNLIQTHGGGRDDGLRKLVRQLHNYAQARPDAAGWLAQKRAEFAAPDPVNWQQWLPEAIAGWREEWRPVLAELQPSNEKAAELALLLARLDPPQPDATWRQQAADVLSQVVAAGKTWPAGRKTLLSKPLESLFPDAEFLLSLAVIKDGVDPLVEDWSWVRAQLETLLRLAEEFAGLLDARKRNNGVLDFHDLEQFALKLLWDFSTGQPSPSAIAAAWRAKLKFVFVDEYQDINAAQDKIIQGLSRDAAEANRFLVGDVKQSIYRFRLADPKIFRDYARQWRKPAGTTLPLSENFRSREGLLQLVNSVFRLVMCEEIGGVAYDAAAELRFGSRSTRRDLSAARDAVPPAELLVRFKRGRQESREDDAGPLAGLDEAQCEARMVARRLRDLMRARQAVFDPDLKRFRPVKWRDMAILLRSPRGHSEVFAKEFERAGIPLAVARGGFYDSAEILDLLSLLQLLDNPLQDVPCIAVLRSPLVGLSLDELAEIRLAVRDGHYWTALQVYQEQAGGPEATHARLARFLDQFSRWRRLAKLVSLSQCLEAVLTETLYADWLRAQPRGVQRAANVASLLHLAQQFDQFQRQGLYRFLKFIEAQQEAAAEPEVPAAAVEDAVRLMSIHQSKGLEFPVVVLADLSRQFNEQDLRGEIIFDETYGLCPKIKPPPAGQRYPSLAYWLAQHRQKRELRGEELRLLYVALTRARDHLILTASVTEKNWNEKWRQTQQATARKIAAARCYADWLALWFAQQSQPRPLPVAAPTPADTQWLTLWFPDGGPAHAASPGATRGQFKELRWQIIPDDPAEAARAAETAMNHRPSVLNPEPDLAPLLARLEWSYPFAAATRRKAKSSVTVLRHEAGALDEEAEPFLPDAAPLPSRRLGRDSRLNAAEVGAAHHKFLQHFALDQAGALAAEADRLAREKYLAPEERSALDLAVLSAFWQSEVGQKILAQREHVRRELPFTARFTPPELQDLTHVPAELGLDAEQVIVQGVADLVVLLPQEIWLLDFKTDQLSASDLPAKVKIYAPQIRLYAQALEKIFTRPVTLRALHFLAAGHTEVLADGR